MRNHDAIAGLLGQTNGRQGLRKRADLIRLHQHGHWRRLPARHAGRVRGWSRRCRPPTSCARSPSSSVSRRQPSQSSSSRPSSMDEIGCASTKSARKRRISGAAKRSPFAGEHVAAIPMQLGGGAVQGQLHVVAQPIAGRRHRLFDDSQRLDVWKAGRAQSHPRRRPSWIGHVRRAGSSKRGTLSTPQRSASRNEPGRAGCTMNSCRSMLLLAWAPPLMMFIIGTGRRMFESPRRRGARGDGTRVLAWRQRRLVRSPRTQPGSHWPPRRLLLGVPFEIDQGAIHGPPDLVHPSPSTRRRFHRGCQPRRGARPCRRSGRRRRRVVRAPPSRRWRRRMVRRPSQRRRS